MSKGPSHVITYAIGVAILLTLSWSVLQSFRTVGAQQECIEALNVDGIRYLTLYPNYDPNSLLDDSVNIYDRQIISQVVDVYKHMRAAGAGDGKLSGRWQLTLTFITYDHQQITSDIYHNDYADLVFISTPVSHEMKGIGDMLASNEISQVLFKALASKRHADP
jgi:hypothetical protein